MKTVTFDETKYVLVPKEPTGVMKDAGASNLPINAASAWIAGVCYRAMLAAAEATKGE